MAARKKASLAHVRAAGSIAVGRLSLPPRLRANRRRDLVDVEVLGGYGVFQLAGTCMREDAMG